MRTFVCDRCGKQFKNGTPSGNARIKSSSQDLEVELCKECVDQLLNQLKKG